jgi:hypothetical protein
MHRLVIFLWHLGYGPLQKDFTDNQDSVDLLPIIYQGRNTSLKTSASTYSPGLPMVFCSFLEINTRAYAT